MGPPVLALRVFKKPRFPSAVVGALLYIHSSRLHCQPEQMPQLESIVLGQEATGTRSKVRLSQGTLSVSTFFQETRGYNHGAVAECTHEGQGVTFECL